MANPFHSTGSPIVDRMCRLQFTGNVIPAAWYRTIIRDNGKPNLTAIIILSDVVYWYRPVEIRDELTGQLCGFKKKFKADILQRNYQQLADQFGISKREAVNAVVELEKIGVVKRVFRTVRKGGMRNSNVLFLELNVDVLIQLTYPENLSDAGYALLTLIQIRKEKDSGAAGIQRGRDTINYFCMEYPGNQGKYVMTYNSKNGRFSGILKTEERNEKLPGIREGKNTGEQYLALLAYANLVPDNPLFNEEFQKNFYILEEQEKKEWEDKEAALRAAFICCDAMYCEVIANPQQAIPLEKSQFRAEELEDVLPEYKIAAGVYAPNDEIYGKFHVLLPVNEKTKRTLFELKQIYSGRWDVNERTKERIPSLPEDYLVSKEAEEILQMVDKTPARLFMLTGDAGTGKTTDARMIAQILGLPYYVFTCGPGTDELELLATTVPNMGGIAHLEMELPRLEDIEMDPASALATVNGIYEEGISREKAFREILKAVYEKGYEKSKNEKDFLLKESEIVKACREPSVIEIQEPAMIEKPGTLTRLNSLFDDGAVTDLVNGEQIRRNPDTIVIMTTNLDYVGCQNFNQSVLSRMNLIQPKEALTEEEMAKRAMKRTGFKNKELLSFMTATVCKIHEYLIEQDITDGVCGYRELENWVLSYMVSNDLRRSAWTALLSKASMDREERGTMERIFLLPHCDVD